MSKQLPLEVLVRLEKALPKWAYNVVHNLNVELGYAKNQIKILETLNRITADEKYLWITFPNNNDEWIKLFTLNSDGADQMCSIPPRGTMFIGYKKEED